MKPSTVLHRLRKARPVLRSLSTYPASPSQSLPDQNATKDRPHSPKLHGGPDLSDWLHLAFLVNSLGDSSAGHDLPFDEIYQSIDGGYFPLILMAYAGRCPDFSFMQSPDGTFQQLNTALRSAAAEFRGRHFLKGGVAQNGFCLAQAIVLEAIRQKFAIVSQPAPRALSAANNS